MSADLQALEQRVAALEAGLVQARAERAALDLLAAYAAGCDANDVDAVAALFEESAVLTVPAGPVDGRTAIRAWYAERLVRSTKHHVVNTVVTARHADGLSVRSDFLAVAWLRAGAETSVQWGAYVDRLRITADGARFVTRTIEMHGSGELVPAGTTARLVGERA